MPLQATSGAASYDAFGGGAAAVPNYIEDVFQTWLYTGNGSTQTIPNGIALADLGAGTGTVDQTEFTTPGSYTWMCPAGVTSVSVVCVGGGGGGGPSRGGGGGALAYANNIAVTPGTSYTVVVGAGGTGGTGGSTGSNGGNSSFNSISCRAGGGGGGGYTGDTGQGGTVLNGAGGAGGSAVNIYSGGGGAGGYTGNGGNAGHSYSVEPTNGSGGGGSGGGSSFVNNWSGGGGGGVGLLGQGANGVCLNNGPWLTSYGAAGAAGGGGSGGANGGTASSTIAGNGGGYGGGGGSGQYNQDGTYYPSGSGAGGGVRIIWPGNTRSFPSNSTGNVTPVGRVGGGISGGLVWIKSRGATTNNFLFDTNRGALNELNSNNTEAQASLASSLTAFNSNGFSLGSAAGINVNAVTYASWTFRKQPKFFDVVTWTGTGSAQNIPHNLGSRPGAVFIKATSTTGNWTVWVRGGTNAWYNGLLDATGAMSGPNLFDSLFTTTTITNSANSTAGVTYVAYLFASNAGGFGLTGTDNVISCGSYTGNGSATGPVINLGYEPQWLMVKRAVGGTGPWLMVDNMRGFSANGSTDLLANSTSSEYPHNYLGLNATGFQPISTDASVNTSGSTYIYIAIRRGPMRVPTTGASVFGVATRAGTSSATTVNVGITADLALSVYRNGIHDTFAVSRLTGNNWLQTNTVAAQSSSTNDFPSNPWDVMNGFHVGVSVAANLTGCNYVYPSFRRAPGFFDVVCYTGTGAALTLNHNLGVPPELVITKIRNASGAWTITATAGALSANFFYSNTFTNAALGFFQFVGNPTSTTLTVGFANTTFTSNSGSTYVAYLFASCPGVSKLGIYTGNGSSQTINCGFTSGARFIMIKRVNDTGDWYVWDTARGIVAASDPHLALNTTAAENTLNDSVDPASTGFIVNQVVATNINVTSATYIYLAIA